jgi:C_GCAxxG_C_C family probable redox protein
MSEEHGVSRRATLKGLGAMSAAMVFGGAAFPLHAEPTPAGGDQNKDGVNVVELAVDRMAKGHSCAQAVCSALAEQMGVDYQTAVRVSSGFGGGMGLGSACGAVTGGIMAIGLKYGGPDRTAQMQAVKVVREFADRFRAQHKSINCTDLIGVDLSKIDLSKPDTIDDAYKAALAKNAFAVCPGLVRDAATIVNTLLNEAPK